MKRRPTESRRNPAEPPDPFEAALKADAARIRAEIPPELDRRIDAALARERRAPDEPARRQTFVRPWLAGSLVGLGVAAVVMLLVARVDERPPPRVSTPEASVADATPEYLQVFREQVPLRAETAELTAPLQQELRDLQSDLEKAREDVERDLRLTF